MENKNYTIESILGQLYLGLLNRQIDENGLNSYKDSLLNGQQIKDVVKSIINSQEFFMKYHDFSHHMLYGGHVAYAYEKPAVAFVHIPKTAGQSLHYLFKQKYGEKKVSPLFNNLSLLPINFAYSYDVIFGHTDYETVKLVVQRKELKLITFFRDPIERLISLYKFWWSHDPEIHKDNFAVELANKYSPEEFFKAKEVKEILWNDMFGRFMGYKFRDTVKKMLFLLNERSKQIYIETVLKPLIHERIKDYFYIGMQDNFAQDVIEMFNKLEIPCTKEDIEKARVNITDENIGKHGFKNIKPDFQITDKVISSISELTELDMLLYEEVKKFKEKQNSTETVEKIIFDDFMKKNSEIVIDALYKSILNRKPDSEGLRHYSDVIKNSNGDGLWMVISALINSQEFKEKQNLLH
ncbi:MAG: DUF4214 domain-containing protein [Candidatus Diapherotrites archaeon]|nr:DUF4214 domain-containing protein [Candidatus Diapherotrites archaeon]